MLTLSRHATIEERIVAALPTVILPRLPFVRFTRNGALSFLRIGRLQLSWCMCRKPAPAKVPTRRVASDADIADAQAMFVRNYILDVTRHGVSFAVAQSSAEAIVAEIGIEDHIAGGRRTYDLADQRFAPEIRAARRR